MQRRVVLASSVLLLSLASGSASALELHEGATSHAAITLPDDWAVSTDGVWALADAPDHRAHVRIASPAPTTGALGDAQAEAFLINFIAETWATYTVDRHVRHVTCGRFIGVEIMGHGAGDSWDRAKFHLFLLVDPAAPQKPAVVLVSGREDGWDTYHALLDRAVHALH
jgi:hypothetical protein